MNTPIPPTSPDVLLQEVEARMVQALDNFFQRSRHAILDDILRAIGSALTPSMLTRAQNCTDWLNAHPDRLSAAFAGQFRLGLERPVSASAVHADTVGELRLVDDEQFNRQLEEDRAVTRITHALGPEMTVLFNRLASLQQAGDRRELPQDRHGPRAVVAALSQALDALEIETPSGNLLLRHAIPSLQDTLQHTYAALNQYLAAQGIRELAPAKPVVTTRRPREPAMIGEDILAHIQSAAARAPSGPGAAASSGPPAASGGSFGTSVAMGTAPACFADSLDFWQANLSRMAEIAPDAPKLVLRQLQQHAHETDASGFDLAMLDAVAGLFEYILEDPDISPDYKSEIAQLQIPVLRVALVSPAFFSDDNHPARRMIDLLGQFSRRFPDSHSAHVQALQQVEFACAHIINQPGRQFDAFVEAYDTLAAWLENENARADTKMAAEVASLEQIERQELGTLLALENLQDLTTRYPAPESVLRRMEAAWVPHMASLYVAEAGEGPEWRAACATLLQLFLSLQAPEDAETRETRLLSIPRINAELRKGLLAQGAEPEHLRDFYGAITATQECWIRPELGRQEAAVSHFVPQAASLADIETLARRLADTPPADPALQQAESLQEGDWVDFDPPREGLDTARVAWVGVHGYLLFCDSVGETRFSLDSTQLAEEIHAGRASIPEQSLTRKAMLRLRTQLQDNPA